jgi:hypothetical protein
MFKIRVRAARRTRLAPTALVLLVGALIFVPAAAAAPPIAVDDELV